MAEKIKIWWGVSTQSGTEEVSFEDLGITEQEWDALPNNERNEKLQWENLGCELSKTSWQMEATS